MQIDKTLIITKEDTFETMAQKIYQNSVNHGWHDRERSWDELCALLHSEVSEMFEELREDVSMIIYFYDDLNIDDEKHFTIRECYEKDIFQAIQDYKPEGYGVELADLVIRLLDSIVDKKIKIDWNWIKEFEDYNKIIYPYFVSFLHEMISSIFRSFVNSDCYTDDDMREDIVLLLRHCLSFAKQEGFDLFEMIRIKHKYNLTRPVKHGGKRY